MAGTSPSRDLQWCDYRDCRLYGDGRFAWGPRSTIFLCGPAAIRVREGAGMLVSIYQLPAWLLLPFRKALRALRAHSDWRVLKMFRGRHAKPHSVWGKVWIVAAAGALSAHTAGLALRSLSASRETFNRHPDQSQPILFQLLLPT